MTRSAPLPPGLGAGAAPDIHDLRALCADDAAHDGDRELHGLAGPLAEVVAAARPRSARGTLGQSLTRVSRGRGPSAQRSPGFSPRGLGLGDTTGVRLSVWAAGVRVGQLCRGPQEKNGIMEPQPKSELDESRQPLAYHTQRELCGSMSCNYLQDCRFAENPL